jgi:uncharacterized protein (DUF3820 family)
LNFNKEVLLESLTYPMPFGKYKDVKVCDLPIFYLEWFLNKDGFPKGKLGDMMTLIYQIKLNGLEEIIVKLKKEIKD